LIFIRFRGRFIVRKKRANCVIEENSEILRQVSDLFAVRCRMRTGKNWLYLTAQYFFGSCSDAVTH
jgi:hypothetical protein